MPPDSVLIRVAEEGDLAVLQPFAVSTWRTAFAHTYDDPADPDRYVDQELSLPQFEQALSEDTILLAIDKDANGDPQLVGYLQIGPAAFSDLVTDPLDQDLRRLYVAPGRQREGIGHRLLDAALALESVRAAGRVFLDVWEHNAGAQKLYRSYGFRVIAQRRFVSPGGTPGDVDYQMCRDQRGVA